MLNVLEIFQITDNFSQYWFKWYWFKWYEEVKWWISKRWILPNSGFWVWIIKLQKLPSLSVSGCHYKTTQCIQYFFCGYLWFSFYYFHHSLPISLSPIPDWPLALRGTQWLKTTIYLCYLAFCGSNRVHWHQLIFTFQSRLGYAPRSII